jgi:hypothetical protein
MTRRITAAVTALCAAATLIGLAAAGVAARPTRAGRSDSGTAYVSTNRTVGKTSWGSGVNSDKRLGSGAITFKYTLTPQAGGSLQLNGKRSVMYTRTGSIAGTITALITVKGTAETITDGKIRLTHGAGSLKGHSLVGTFSGSGSATANQFTIHYKGTFK